MRSLSWVMALGWPVALVGCFAGHSFEWEPAVDGGAPRRGDAGAAGCVDRGCDSGWRCDRSLDRCVSTVEGCQMWRDRTDDRAANMRYCGENLCLVPHEDEGAETLAGTCVAESTCIEALDGGLGASCFYVDRSPYVEGPPDEGCPELPEGPSGFCGPGCRGCEPIPDPYDTIRASCVGVNEERGLGLCVFNSQEVCERRQNERGRLQYAELATEMRYGRAVCVVPVDAAGRLADWGWFAFDGGCRAYRARYPGVYECVDADWRPVP